MIRQGGANAAVSVEPGGGLNLKEAEKLAGGVTAAPGFQAGAAAAEIKYKLRNDVAVVYSQVPAAAAGVFTKNKVKAAPLLVTKEKIAQGTAQAIVVNSGNANVCNGAQGLSDALAMVSSTADALGLPEELVLVASTGVIGQRLPIDKMLPAIRLAAQNLSASGGALAAEAIMTTDTYPKEVVRQGHIGGKLVTVGGMAKGSGMIHPDMATLLCFMTTDVAITPACLQQALQHAAACSFNMVSVDRDTSTNDMLVVLANGLAGNAPLEDVHSDEYVMFRDLLTEACIALAMDIARDGEGATRLIQVEARNARTLADARLAAKSVAGSNLVKAAMFGRDANWGRVLCAAGYSGADFDPQTVDIFLGPEQVARHGCALDFNEEKTLEILSKDTVCIIIDFHAGAFQATAWGCDLTFDYVRINGEYRT